MHLSLTKTAKWSRRESRIVLVGVENRLNAQIWILGGSNLNASTGSLSGSNPGLRILWEIKKFRFCDGTFIFKWQNIPEDP